MLTEKQLKEAMPNITQSNIDKYLVYLQITAPNFGIDTPLRMAHFLAQIGHESLNLFYNKEIATGKEYEGRKDLGNLCKGDGEKYKGRGLIQITGRSNYKDCSLFIFGDYTLINQPSLLETPENAVKSSCWFWNKNRLNVWADKDDVVRITKIINGGKNGLEDRILRLKQAKKALGI